MALAAIVLLARRASRPDAPAEPGAFTSPVVQRTAAWNVEGVDGATLTVSGGQQGIAQLVLAPSAPVEVLEPMTASEIVPGAWLTVVGVPNEVKNFAIRLLVVIPAPTAPDESGVMRSAAGFAGHEPARDQKESPLLGGTVDGATATGVTLRATAGAVDVVLASGAPLRRLRSVGRASDGYPIRSGDRIAVHLNSDGSPNVAAGVLVFTGGAR